MRDFAEINQHYNRKVDHNLCLTFNIILLFANVNPSKLLAFQQKLICITLLLFDR